jgi:hypothetical protein
LLKVKNVGISGIIPAAAFIVMYELTESKGVDKKEDGAWHEYSEKGRKKWLKFFNGSEIQRKYWTLQELHKNGVRCL